MAVAAEEARQQDLLPGAGEIGAAPFWRQRGMLRQQAMKRAASSSASSADCAGRIAARNKASPSFSRSTSALRWPWPRRARPMPSRRIAANAASMAGLSPL
ncbi:hypothetical protein ACN2CC_24005 [Mesorhizobium muleiense]|uniref:hypothetical protein n=1 Tax=Mesorhizobium muleiense TaxID=1004279 RepID=UPI003AFAD5CC